jgi:hypothetical protein
VRYRAWRYSLNRPDISLSFNPKMWRKPAEFRALIALGPSIIPLVVDKLTRRDDFSALQIYDALQDASTHSNIRASSSGRRRRRNAGSTGPSDFRM